MRGLHSVLRAGRVVLLPHELLLSNTALMVGSALWVSGRDSVVGGGEEWKSLVPRFVMDPLSKAWSRLENDWSYTQVEIYPGCRFHLSLCNKEPAKGKKCLN